MIARSQPQLRQQPVLPTEGAAGGAFEFFHEVFERFVGGVAGAGVFDGVAFGFVLFAAGAGEVVEFLLERGEAGGGVAAFGEFGFPRVLAGGGVAGLSEGDEAAGVLGHVAFELRLVRSASLGKQARAISRKAA